MISMARTRINTSLISQNSHFKHIELENTPERIDISEELKSSGPEDLKFFTVQNNNEDLNFKSA